MIKTTEELKHEMYSDLNRISRMISDGCVPKRVLPVFEDALEAYLERLHNEATSSAARLEEQIKWADICSSAYAHQQQLTHAACVSERETWAENHELKSRIRELEAFNSNGEAASLRDQVTIQELREDRAKLCDERDLMRNRLQALQSANAAAGEEYRAAQALIKRQREIIGELYMAKATRKVVPGTSSQSSDEKSVVEVLGAFQRLCQHSWRRLVAYPGGKDHQECIFCLKIEEA